MQIHNVHIQPHSLPEPKGRKSAAASAQSGNAPAAPGQENGLSSTLENADALMARLKELPEVREDVVATAKARLAAGEYSTRQAAADTAAAIFNWS